MVTGRLKMQIQNYWNNTKQYFDSIMMLSVKRAKRYNNLPMNHLCSMCDRGVDDWGLGSSSWDGSHHSGQNSSRGGY